MQTKIDLDPLYVDHQKIEPRFLQGKQTGEECKNLSECFGNLQCCKAAGEYDTGICKLECISGN